LKSPGPGRSSALKSRRNSAQDPVKDPVKNLARDPVKDQIKNPTKNPATNHTGEKEEDRFIYRTILIFLM